MKLTKCLIIAHLLITNFFAVGYVFAIENAKDLSIEQMRVNNRSLEDIQCRVKTDYCFTSINLL